MDFLEIEEKQNHPIAEAAKQQYGSKYFLAAEETNQIVDKINQLKEMSDETNQVLEAIADGTGGKAYPDLTTAMAVTPLPEDNVIFTIDSNNESEKGVYAYDSGEVDGYRFVRGFADGEVALNDNRPVSGDSVATKILQPITADLVIGGISTADGTDSGGNTRVKTVDYLKEVSEISVLSEAVIIAYAIYYKDGIFVSRQSVNSSNYEVDYPGESNEVRFSFKNEDNSSFANADIEYLMLGSSTIDFQLLYKDVESAKYVVEDYDSVAVDVMDSDIEYGGIGTSDGLPTSYNTIRIRTSDYINVLAGKKYMLNDIPEGFVVVRVFKYLNGNYVGNRNATNGTFLQPDETYNQIKVAFSKLDSGEEITNGELNDFSFSLILTSKSILSTFIPEIPNLTKRVTKLEDKTTESPYIGLKMASLGDSVTYGFVPRNDPDYPGQLDSYAKLTAEALGMVFENYGISGSTLGAIEEGTTERNPFVYRYDNLPDDADVVTVMGGTNDIRNNILLGSFSDTDETTYYGALKVLCEALLNKYRIEQGTEVGKDKIIVFLTPIKMGTEINQEYNGHTLADYAEAVKEVCAYYSIPVFDAYNLSGITPHILRTVEGTEPGYTDFYNPYITDGVHPNQAGQEIFSRSFVGFLKTLK